MALSPTLPDVIEAAVSRRLSGTHTAILGEMTSYDAAAFTCGAKLCAKINGQEVPDLADVPVVIPGAWAAGDSVLLVFSEEDFSGWFASGVVQAAPSKRRHGLYAVAVPLIAREGQAVQFVALANLVDARLETIRTTWFVNTGMGPSSTPAAAGATALASVAAAKVKAR
jgi:hypothetical protein